MALLSGLMSKARELLGRSKPTGSAKDAIAQGELDQLIYERLLEDAPALGELAKELRMHHVGTDDLVRDMVMGFYQATPKLRTQPEMDPSRLTNWAVAQQFENSPTRAEARAYTVGDKYAAVMATLGSADRIKDTLNAAAEEVTKKAERAAQAQEELEKANADMLQAMQDAAAGEEALQEAGGDEAAAAAAAALAEQLSTQLGVAITKAEYAAEAAEISAQQAQAAAERSAKQMRGAIADAMGEAANELARQAELIQAWGVDEGEVEHMSYAEREELARMLSEHEVSKYLQLLGRFMFAERSLRAKRVVPGRDEVYSIERSGRLHDLLMSQLTMLANKHTRLQFLQAAGEGQLLTRAYRGTEKSGKGACVLCVDTSGSMKAGRGYSPAAWSKAFALALLQRCRADGRDFVGIIFSSRHQVQVFRFPKGRGPLPEILEFVGKAFNGGTNFEAPLDTAIDIIEDEYNTEGRGKGDIIFVTDDNCNVTPDWFASYKRRKTELGFRTWGIACGKTLPGRTLSDLSDNVRAIHEFFDPSPVADLLKAI